jgi:hypothetical protein
MRFVNNDVICGGSGKILSGFCTFCDAQCLETETFPMKFCGVKKYVVRFVDVSFKLCFDFKTFSISNRQHNLFCVNFWNFVNPYDNFHELSIIIKNFTCGVSFLRHTGNIPPHVLRHTGNTNYINTHSFPSLFLIFSSPSPLPISTYRSQPLLLGLEGTTTLNPVSVCFFYCFVYVCLDNNQTIMFERIGVVLVCSYACV